MNKLSWSVIGRLVFHNTLLVGGIGKFIWLKYKRMYEINLSNEVIVYIFSFFDSTICWLFHCHISPLDGKKLMLNHICHVML